MKNTVISLLFVLMIYSGGSAEEPFGNVLKMSGDVDITDTRTNKMISSFAGMQIYSNYRIRTANKASSEILLMDGTKIFMHEGSVVRVANLRIKKGDLPTRVNILNGKVRINVNRPIEGRTLIVETPTAIAGVFSTETDFGLIATRFETRVAVFYGELDIANSNRMVNKSFTLMKKEESIVQTDIPPTEPLVLPPNIFDAWMDYYEIIGGDKISVKGKSEDGIIGHILKKRKF